MHKNLKKGKFDLNDEVNGNLVIGFTGEAKSGKDTAAHALYDWIKSNYFTELKFLSFADPIREIGRIFGYTDEQMSNQSLKETYLDNKITNVTPRKFMQVVGTDMFRNSFDKDIWVKLLASRIEDNTITEEELNKLNSGTKWNPYRIYFITDVRFPNESDLIHKHNGIVIRVTRKDVQSNSGEWRKHESEKVMSEIKPDYVWDNDIEGKDIWCKKCVTMFAEIIRDKHIVLR